MRKRSVAVNPSPNSHRPHSLRKNQGSNKDMPFTCSICEEESTRICVACTKDNCDNHLCEKCSRCSDCCGCEVALNHGEHSHPQSVGGPEPFLASEPLTEPTGIPPEGISGEAADTAQASARGLFGT